MAYQTSFNIKAFVVLMLAIFGFARLYAQDRLKFSVADFDIDPFDLSAKDTKYEKFDGNGERYAIIKVTSTNPADDLNEYSFNFGNMKHVVEDHDGTLWLYVQKNAKMVTITRNGYLPINRYDLNTSLESGKNYVMTLSSEEKKVYMQMVQFNVRPLGTNAVVMVRNGIPGSQEELLGYVDATGSVAKNLAYGNYTYKVMAENYRAAEGRFTLDNRGKTLVENVELKPNYSEMTFKVDADAEIYINGELKGTRQWSGVLNAGRYYVECRQPDHKPSSQTVEVTDNDNRTVELKSPTPITGTLAIISNPLGADFSIDGTPYGQTPQNIDLLVGKHTVDVTKTGYKPVNKSIDVKEDKTVDLDVTLIAAANTLIESDPTNSKLYINGKYKGVTPYTYDGEAGNFKLKLTSKGYEPLEKNVFLGDTDHLAFTLEKKEKGLTIGTVIDTPDVKNKTQIISSRNLEFYAEAGIGIGAAMNTTISGGAYIKHFNVEIDYSYGLNSPTLYWTEKKYLTSYYDYAYKTYYHTWKYRPMLMLAGKIGYGINIGYKGRFQVTPQIGCRFIKLSEKSVLDESYFEFSEDGEKYKEKDEEYYYEGEYIKGANFTNLTIGIRGYYKINSVFGVSVTPEYSIGVLKNKGYKTWEPLTVVGSEVTQSKMTPSLEGFNTKISLVITF